MQRVEELTPEWLDNKFLLHAIKSYKRDDSIEVISFDIRTEFSVHYSSSMFQSKVEFRSMQDLKSQPEILNVVIKAEPTVVGDLRSTVVDGGALFETEIRMYKETLPAIHQLFQRCGLKAELSPELIYATDKPFPIIVLKDLTQDGFYAPFQPPEELEDSKLIIRKLAQFHAASYFLAETNQQDFSNYDYNIYKNEDLFKGFFLKTLTAFKAVVETWEGFQEFVPKLDYLIENMPEIGRKCYTANKPGNGYNVLNHGDFHLRNMLVKGNDITRIEKFLFIDYQLSVYCSPCVDITYMFQIVNRDKDGELPMNDLIMMYHEEFAKALKTFGYESSPPSLLDVNVELLKHGAINMLIMICFFPYSYMNWSKLTAEDMMKAYEQPLVKKLLQREMKSWVYKGWI